MVQFSALPPSYWIMECMQQLGYTSDLGGVCFGMAHMGMQAILARDLAIFDQRLQRIHNLYKTGTLKAEVEKARRNPSSDNPLLEIPPFFDGLELYHQPFLYPYLFESEKKLDQNAVLTAPLVMSQSLEKQQGFIKAGHFTGAYTQCDLNYYFYGLLKAIEKNGTKFRHPIAFILRSEDHAVVVGMDPQNKKWCLIDINHLPTKYFDEINIYELAKNVKKSFSKSDVVVFSSTVYGMAQDEKALEELIKQLKNQSEWKKIHAVDGEKSQTVDSCGQLLYLAARDNDVDKVNALLPAARYKKSFNDKTALYIAAQKGSLEAVKSLLAAGNGDINIATTEGATSLHCAANEGHADIVSLLLANGADVNATYYGATPLLMAAQAGHAEIVRMLLAHGADCSALCKDVSPLYLATQNGHLEVVKILLDAGADIDHLTNGLTAGAVAENNLHYETATAIYRKKITNYLSQGVAYDSLRFKFSKGNNSLDSLRPHVVSHSAGIK